MCISNLKLVIKIDGYIIQYIMIIYLLNNNIENLRSDIWYLNYIFFIFFFDIFIRKYFLKIIGFIAQHFRVCIKFLKVWLLSNKNDNIIVNFGFFGFKFTKCFCNKFA